MTENRQIKTVKHHEMSQYHQFVVFHVPVLANIIHMLSVLHMANSCNTSSVFLLSSAFQHIRGLHFVLNLSSQEPNSVRASARQEHKLQSVAITGCED